MDISKIDITDDKASLFRAVKRRFFAFRNGVVADALRHAGSSYRIIFGLNLPQLKEISNVFTYDEILGQSLWEDISTRESRLLAPMLINPDTFPLERAKIWIASLSSNHEEIDFLCNFLLRKTNYDNRIVEEYSQDKNPVLRYMACRLCLGNIQKHMEAGKALAEREIAQPNSVTYGIANQLIEEYNNLNYD